MLKEIPISEYLGLAKTIPIIDVRSPGEYEKGHIPHATNIPLFDNKERAHVGTVYKQESREAAIEVGYTYVNPKLDWFISASRKVAPDGTIAVHCWRGGMRSKAFAQHLSENGFHTIYVLIGGYKAFRNYALDAFNIKADIYLLGGYTGSGKTYILKELENKGEQILDLEGIARHKGSAFGAIGQGKQPSIEQFENDVFWAWKDMDFTKTIWIEDESHRIGLVNIPMNLYVNMRSKPVIFLEVPREERTKLLLKDYTTFNKDLLSDAIKRISKRLGGLDTKKALHYIETNNFYEAIMITLRYYDKYYLKGLNNRDHSKIYNLKTEQINIPKNAQKLLKFYKTLVNDKHKTHTI